MGIFLVREGQAARRLALAHFLYLDKKQLTFIIVKLFNY